MTIARNSKTWWLKNPLAIFTANPEDARGGLVVSGDKIVELVPLGATPDTPVDTVWDARHHVLIPGLINTHHHLYQTLTRAYPPALNKALFPWLNTLYPVWAGLQPEMLAAATELGLAELMLSGCSTIADHHYLYPEAVLDAMAIQVEAARALGCRVTLTRGSMSLGKAQGGLPPQSVVQSDADILEDCARVIQRFHDRSASAFVQIALAPCSPFSVSRELMTQTAVLAKSQGVRLHTHLAETEDETVFCERMFGERPLDYLEATGWLNEQVWLAHGIHFNRDELARLAKHGVGIAHCPSSNMVLASGICRTKEFEGLGGVIGLAVDGSASNDGSNMMQEVRQALLINRLRYAADEVTHQDVLYWATKGGARLLGRDELGEFAAGKQADIACFSLDAPRFSGAHDPLAALVLCGAHAVDRLMIGGAWRVMDGVLVGPDLQAIQARHRLQAERLVAGCTTG